jgi:MFS family permease
MAEELGLSRASVFGAFSVSLTVMALAGPPVGRVIDEGKGRGLLVLSNLVLAAGLVFLGWSASAFMLFAAWCVLGIGMAMGLYDSAFAILVRLYGASARGSITGITLMAGFASTIGWPLTAYVSGHFGWRTACFSWAALHLAIALPLNYFCIPTAARSATREPALESPAHVASAMCASGRDVASQRRRAFVFLATFSALTAFVTSAMAAHLPGLLLATGVSSVAALTAAALVGPAQVAARLAEFIATRQFSYHPLVTARSATVLHPLGALALSMFGGTPFAASFFALVHGAGNGLITIAKGTLPLAIFGAAGYGARQGWLAVLARITQAVAPYAFGVVLDGYGVRVSVLLSAALSIVALAALFGLSTAGAHRAGQPA